jgi:DNA-binding IclR family transcriptional regulator
VPPDDVPPRDVSLPSARMPQNHRTVDRVTRILEEVVYRPGMTFGELSRAVDAPKSSVHGFVGGLLAQGWLYETDRRFYLGPAVYALTLASGHIRAGSVTDADLKALHEETQFAVFLGVQAGEHLIYIADLSSDPVSGFEARSNIRRTPLATAGGKALIAARPDAERESYLRRRSPDEAELVRNFLEALPQIRATRIATNIRNGGRRFGLATTLANEFGEAVASVTLVGPAAEMEPQENELSEVLLRHVDSWQRRPVRARGSI